MINIKWTDEMLQEAANKCNTRGEFKKRFGSAYVIARKRGLLNQLFVNHPDFGWTVHHPEYWNDKKKCADAANKCQSLAQFKNFFTGAYKASIRNGWFDELSSHFIVLGNNKNKAVYIIKNPSIPDVVYIGISYDPNTRFKNHSTRGYQKVKDFISSGAKLEILTDILPIKKAMEIETKTIAIYKNNGFTLLNQTSGGEAGGSDIRNTKEYCQSLANKCKTKREMTKRYNGPFLTASRNGWLNELFKNHENNGDTMAHKNGWDIMELQKLADSCVGIKEFRKKYPAACLWCTRKGILNKLFINHKNGGYSSNRYKKCAETVLNKSSKELIHSKSA